MTSYATLTVPVRDILGYDFHESRASVWIEPNVPVVLAGAPLAGGIRVGGRREQIVAGVATFPNLVTTDSADNPTSFGYRVTISAPPKGASKREDMIVLTTSDFPLTTTASLVDIPEAWDNITIPPNWKSDFRDEMEALRDQAAASAALADSYIVADLNTSDGQMEALVESPTSLTAKALDAAYGTFVSVKQYGATGDGTTDDTAAIQAALSANPLATFFFPRGTYLISDTLILGERQRFVGTGKYNSTIRQTGTVLNGKPLISTPVTTSAPSASTTAYNHIGLRDLGVVFNRAARTEYPVLFMNARSFHIEDCYIGVFGAIATGPRTANADWNNVYFGRSSAGVGATWASRITGTRFYHTGLRFELHTDAYVLDNEFNCIENNWALWLNGTNGLQVSRNQIIGEVVLGDQNISIDLSHNYWDGYYKHDIGYEWSGISVRGLARQVRVIGNFFYELPGYGIVRTGAGKVQQWTIVGNDFDNCDIFKTGKEDIAINDTADSRGVLVQGNVFRRSKYFTPDGTSYSRSTSDTNRVGAVRILTANTDSDEYDAKSIVSGNTAEYNTGYTAAFTSGSTVMENNYPTGIFPPSSRWVTYTPNLTFGGVSWTPGNATVTAKSRRTGNTVTATGEVIFGTTSVIPTGNLFITLPRAVATVAHGSGRAVVGSNYYPLAVRVGATETVIQLLHAKDATNNGIVSHDAPAAFVSGSRIGFTITYETDV